jgi:GNAT superfamily N-acetyltransferase
MRGPEWMRLPEGAQEEQDGPVWRRWGWAPRGLVSASKLSRLGVPQLDALIKRQIEFFAERSLAFEWKTYAHDQQERLCERLLAQGFVPEERENLVIGRVSEIDQYARPPAGVTLRRVSSRADTDRMAELLTVVAGADRSFLGQLFFQDRQTNPDQVVLLVAEAEGQVVATGRLNLEGPSQFASLWAGSTLPEWRRRGIYRALVAYRARLAAERGFLYLQVDASENSRPILERLGLQTVSSTTPYIWSPPT